MRHKFVGERAIIAAILWSSCHWKSLSTFCLRKKRSEKNIFNTNSKLLQDGTEKKICHAKQH